MKNYIIHLNIGVCSHWGRKLPKHIFKTTISSKVGHRYCLNCGMTKAEVRKEEKSDMTNYIETRVFDINSSLDKPKFL